MDNENPATVDKDDLIDWVEEKIVVYHGFYKDVRPMIAQSDCIVLPSYREAIPRSITEAMAMAKAVITTDTAGCKEAVDDGVNGYLVGLKDVQSLVSSFERFIHLSYKDREKMGIAGRVKVEKEFDDRRISEVIYNTVIE